MSANFIGYLIGYIIVTIGVGYALNAAGVPSEWIIAAVLILIGLGIIYAISRSERDRAYRNSTRPKPYRENYVEQPGRADRYPGEREDTTRRPTTTRTYE